MTKESMRFCGVERSTSHMNLYLELEVSHLVRVRARVRARVRLVLGARGEPPAQHRHREEHLVEVDNYGTGVITTEHLQSIGTGKSTSSSVRSLRTISMHPVLAAKKSKERAVWQMAKVGSE